MSLRKKKIVAKMVGGLGNQLFIYFAARSLAKKIGGNLSLDFSFIEKSHSSGLSRLDAFHLEAEIIESNNFGKLLKENRERIIDGLANRGLHFAGRNYLDESSIEKAFSDTFINSFYLRGFHSTTKYYEELGRPEILIKETSPAYSDLREKIKSSVAIHVRGGDYGRFRDTFGPLSHLYYLNVFNTVKEVESIASVAAIYIFSDDRERSSRLKMFLASQGYAVVEVIAEYMFSPAEELLLISSAKAIIMANSTFSFWASELSMKESLIIAPASYTRAGGTVDFGSSRKRILIRSEWE